MRIPWQAPLTAQDLQARLGPEWTVTALRGGRLAARKGKGLQQTTARFAPRNGKLAVSVAKGWHVLVSVVPVAVAISVGQAVAQANGSGFGLLDAALFGGLGGGLGALLVMPFKRPAEKEMAARLTTRAR